jgi:hypothetical protein
MVYNKLKIILLTLFFLFICIGSMILYNTVSNDAKNQRLDTPNKILEFAVKNINTKAPILLDDSTRLDYASATSETELIYNYTIISRDSFESKKKQIKLIEPSLRRKILTNDDMNIFRDNGIEIIYLYYDIDGREIAKIKVKW